MAKLILNEADSQQARAEIKAALKKGTALYTTDLALTECLNIIWKHTTLLKDIQDPDSAVEDLFEVYDHLTIISTRAIAEETINIATTKNIPVCDATYIALAQKLNGTLYTADKKLASIANTITNTKLLKTLSRRFFFKDKYAKLYLMNSEVSKLELEFLRTNNRCLAKKEWQIMLTVEKLPFVIVKVNRKKCFFLVP